MTDTQRAAFEAWAKERMLDVQRSVLGDDYVSFITNLVWAGWKAAQTADAGREAVALEATPMKPGQFGGTETAWRMDAYYYNFDPTGIAIIDRILSAVACAGKSFHRTECWNDECSPYEHLRGDTMTAWIQNAADDAADVLRGKNVAAINAELVKALEALMDHFDKASYDEAFAKARAALSRAKEQK